MFFGSIVSYVVLLTRHYKVAASYLGVIFISQVIFNGCILTKIENNLRASEGRGVIPDELILSMFSSNETVQVVLTVVISALLVALIIIPDRNVNKLI